MIKKLLIVSVSAGAGHTRAAEAVKKYAEQKFNNTVKATHIDMMDYAGLPLRRAILSSYDLLIKQAPALWGFIYNKSNDPELSKRFRELSRIVNRLNSRYFYEYVRKEKPDKILCTHFLPAQAMMSTPTKYLPFPPTSLLMTDYDKHALLMTKGLENYFVSSRKMIWKMAHHGIDSKKIILSGIPVDPIFYTTKKITILRKKYSIPAGKKIILVLSGGQGMAKIDTVVRMLLGLTGSITLIAIAGKNKSLENKLRSISAPANFDYRVIGWTNDMDEYMRLADIVVTKPGGLTTTECITLQKPIIAVDPIPGQEEQNAAHILEHGFGVSANTDDDLLYYASLPGEELAPGYSDIDVDLATRSIPAEIILRRLMNNAVY